MGRNFDDYPGCQQILGVPILLQQSVLGGMILYFINICFPVSAGDESQLLEIDDVILHPKYDLSSAYHDIAVIKLKPNKGK